MSETGKYRFSKYKHVPCHSFHLLESEHKRLVL